MSYRSRQPRLDGNHRACPGCETPVYWREGPYCASCQTLPIRICPSCNKPSQTLGSTCHTCDAALGPIRFGFDRLVGKHVWDTRDPNSLADAAYGRWIKGAKDDPSITWASCPGCGQAFTAGAKGGYLGATRSDGIRSFNGSAYDERAHRACVDWRGELIRTAELAA